MRFLVVALALAGCSRTLDSSCVASGIDNCCAELVAPNDETSSTCRAFVIGEALTASAKTDSGVFDLFIEPKGKIVRLGACESSDVIRSGDAYTFALDCDGRAYSGAFRVIAMYPR
jgi:hypothetical protein